MNKLSEALIKALIAVHEGEVMQVFDMRGNVFRGPKGISPRSYRRLQEIGLIEDVPLQRGASQRQRLSKAGCLVLAKVEE